MRDLKDILEEVNAHIAAAAAKSGRTAADVEIVAVTKTHGPDVVREAWEAGLRSPEALAAATEVPAAGEVNDQAPAEDDSAIAEEMKKMREREKEKAPPPPNPKDVKIQALGEKRGHALAEERRRRSDAVVARYEPLYLAAKSAGRTHDADYYLSILKSMVDNYEPPKPKVSRQNEK